MHIESWRGRDLSGIVDDWRALLARSDADPLFHSPEWLATWWERYQSRLAAELEVLAARDGNKLTGLALLHRRDVTHKFRMSGVRMELLGAAWRASGIGFSEHLGFIFDKDHLAQAAKALEDALLADPDWDDLVAAHTQIGGPTEQAFRRIAARCNGYVRASDRMEAWAVPLEGDFEGFLARLGSGTRARIIGSRRRLERAGTVRERLLGPDELAEGWEILSNMYQARWHRPLSPHLRDFYGSIALRQMAQGVPVMSLLEFDGHAVSVMVNFRAAATEYSITSAFSPVDVKRVSLGWLHLGLAIERAYADGMTRFDLLGGAGKHEQYKAALAGERSDLICLQVIRSKPMILVYRAWDRMNQLRPTTQARDTSAGELAQRRPAAIRRRTVVRRSESRLNDEMIDLRGAQAIVTGAEHPTALGSARALNLAGAQVIGLTRIPGAAACRSRAWTRIETVNGNDTDTWMNALLAAAADCTSPPFLLLTQDSLIVELSPRRAELENHFRFAWPRDDVVQAFMDKTLFADWASRFSLPLPATRIVHSEAELSTALDELPYPLVLKPLYRTPEWTRLSPVQKVFRITDRGAVGKIDFDLFQAAPSYILSQWIEGPDSAVHYCLAYCARRGEMTHWHTGRKLLQYPRQTGSTAICVNTDNREIRELAAEVFRQADYLGLGSLEVKYGNDGKPYITEPTVVRPNLQSFSSVPAGQNLHAVAMAFALGHEWPARQGHERNCMWIQEEAIVELITTRSNEPVEWRLLLRALLNTRRIRGAYWSWRDPMPLIAYLGRKTARLFQRLLGIRDKP